MNHRLIYDVGMHNGDDTAHYLELGYRVVAIEANPQLAEQARRRFEVDINANRLVLLNVGVADRAGVMTFWVNRKNSEWSSFDHASATKHSPDVEAIEAPVVPFSQVLDEYGVPHFLKIDIEGNDLLCLQALNANDLPRYVSVEAHTIDRLLELRRLGYDMFKCVNQIWQNAPERAFKGRIGHANGLSRYRAGRSESLRSMLRTLKHRSPHLPLVSNAYHAWRNGGPSPTPSWRDTLPKGRFPIGSSGPFGEDTYGPWQSFEEVAFDWLGLKLGRPECSSLTQPGWFDFHAKRLGLGKEAGHPSGCSDNGN